LEDLEAVAWKIQRLPDGALKYNLMALLAAARVAISKARAFGWWDRMPPIL